MFPSKNPLLYIIHLLVVASAVLSTLFLTGNALALLGLMMLPQFPIVAGMGDGQDTQAMGFTANIE